VGNAKEWPGGIDGLKNRSGKCQGPVGGDRRVKEPEWEMRRTGQGGSTGERTGVGNAKDRGGARGPTVV
jgi:hypothetical protein